MRHKITVCYIRVCVCVCVWVCVQLTLELHRFELRWSTLCKFFSVVSSTIQNNPQLDEYTCGTMDAAG